MTYTIKQGDVLEVTRGYPDNYFDGLFCDPPYGLSFMGKGWDTFASEKIKERSVRYKQVYKTDYKHGIPIKRKKPYLSTRDLGARTAGSYDQSCQGHLNFQEFMTEWAKEALRVLKPGAFGLVFGGTRTWHRLAVALEDAGFEIRDTLIWLYGSGFPKSFDISKGIDKAAGAEREVVGIKIEPSGRNRLIESKGICNRNTWGGEQSGFRESEEKRLHTAPATPKAQRWHGYGTALKPSWEPVLLIRKPLDGNNVQNALKHGCGGLNIDGTRIPGVKPPDAPARANHIYGSGQAEDISPERERYTMPSQGRWPANLILDEDTAAMLDAQTPERTMKPTAAGKIRYTCFWGHSTKYRVVSPFDSGGGASRFFYCAKASRTERNAGLEGFEEKQGGTNIKGYKGDGIHDIIPRDVKTRNHHPTVKPLDLCRYLAKLILPPERSQIGNDGSQKGNTRRLYVPFCGSGSEIIGALQAGWDEVEGCDIDPEYCKIAEARLTYWCKREREKIPL